MLATSMRSASKVARNATFASALGSRLPSLARAPVVQQTIKRGVCGNTWYGWHHHPRHGHEHFNRFQHNFKQAMKSWSEQFENAVKSDNALYTNSKLLEKGDAYRIIVEMPGVGKEGVELEVNDGILNIVGKKDVEGVTKKYAVKYDISSEKIETSQIKAKIENGILEVTLPKNAEKQVHSINVE